FFEKTKGESKYKMPKQRSRRQIPEKFTRIREEWLERIKKECDCPPGHKCSCRKKTHQLGLKAKLGK
ncbi:MAG: hypothetical protein AAB906_01270, partial [Patescibacteria group bacterium]